jgi:hypothetical protein
MALERNAPQKTSNLSERCMALIVKVALSSLTSIITRNTSNFRSTMEATPSKQWDIDLFALNGNGRAG